MLFYQTRSTQSSKSLRPFYLSSQKTRLDMRLKESAEKVRRYGQQRESSPPTSKLTELGSRCQRFDRTGKKRTYTECKNTSLGSTHDLKKQKDDDCIGTNFYLIRASQHFVMIFVFGALCMDRDLFFSEERTLVVKNKKHCFSTRALVQCMNYAQPECLRVKAPTFWLSAKKKRFCVWNFALHKQVTMPSQESACSAYAPRTA